MTALAWLIPCALLLGLLGLGGLPVVAQQRPVRGPGRRGLARPAGRRAANARSARSQVAVGLRAHEITEGVPGGMPDQREHTTSPTNSVANAERHEAGDQACP